MIELQRTYRFCASHRLARADWDEQRNLSVFGTASHASGHGHNYRLTVVVGGEPDAATSRVIDLDQLDRVVGEHVVDVYDHKNMNRDVASLEGRVPTLEVVLEDIWERLVARIPQARLLELRLLQDEFTTGVYRGPPGGLVL